MTEHTKKLQFLASTTMSSIPLITIIITTILIFFSSSFIYSFQLPLEDPNDHFKVTLTNNSPIQRTTNTYFINNGNRPFQFRFNIKPPPFYSTFPSGYLSNLSIKGCGIPLDFTKLFNYTSIATSSNLDKFNNFICTTNYNVPSLEFFVNISPLNTTNNLFPLGVFRFPIFFTPSLIGLPKPIVMLELHIVSEETLQKLYNMNNVSNLSVDFIMPNPKQGFFGPKNDSNTNTNIVSPMSVDNFNHIEMTSDINELISNRPYLLRHNYRPPTAATTASSLTNIDVNSYKRTLSQINDSPPPPAADIIDPITDNPYIPSNNPIYVTAKFNAPFINGLKPGQNPYLFIWQLSKIDPVTMMESDEYLQKNNFQTPPTQNALQKSILGLSVDRKMDVNFIWRLSVTIFTSFNEFIYRKESYYSTPPDIQPVQSLIGGLLLPLISVSPPIGKQLDLFTFSCSALYFNNIFRDGSVKKADVEISFAITKDDIGDLQKINLSNLFERVMKITPFSKNFTQNAILPSSVPIEVVRKVINLNLLTNDNYKLNILMLVKDINFGTLKVFQLNRGVVVASIEPNIILNLLKTKLVNLYTLKSVTRGVLQDPNIEFKLDLLKTVLKQLQNYIDNDLNKDDEESINDITLIFEELTRNITTQGVGDSADVLQRTILKFISIINSNIKETLPNSNNLNNGIMFNSMLPITMRYPSILRKIIDTLTNIQKFSNNNNNIKIIKIIKQLTASCAGSMYPQEEKTWTSDTFYYKMKKDYAMNLNSSMMNAEDLNNVNLPSELPNSMYNSSSSSEDIYGMELISYLENPIANSSVNSTTFISNVVSNVISFTMTYDSGDSVTLQNLTDPIILQYTINNENLSKNNLTNFEKNYKCKYYDEDLDIWRTDGCSLSSIVTNNTFTTIYCKCNHTTLFAAFEEFTDTSKLTKEEKTNYTILWSFEIFVGSCFIIISLIILILTIIFRKKQPLKSKFIVPILGMITIIFDSLFTYIIKNIVNFIMLYNSSIFTKELNIIIYISVTITSLCFCTTVLTFLIQVIRYHLLRNLYLFMPSTIQSIEEFKKDKRLKTLRFLTSKLFYILCVLLILFIVLSYFVTVSVIRIVNLELNLSLISPNSYTIIMSAFMGFILVITLILTFTIFIIDFIYHGCLQKEEEENSTNQNNDISTVDNNNNNNTIKSLKKFNLQNLKLPKSNIFKKFFIQQDPLIFRLETFFFIICLTILLISYISGMISTGFLTEENTLNFTNTTSLSIDFILSIVKLVTSVIYYIFYILVFGGISLLFTFKNIKRKKEQKQEEEEDLNEIEEIMKDKFGLPLFEDFARKEFSLENLSCYFSIKDLLENCKVTQQLTSDILEKFKNYKIMYLSSSSSLEVNFPGVLTKSFINHLDILQKEENNLDSFNQMKIILDKMYSETLKNLIDTYSRFESTDLFEVWKAFNDQRELMSNQVGIQIV
ncbi:hypothetical protein ABK040_005062 [Willaertia magna]